MLSRMLKSPLCTIVLFLSFFGLMYLIQELQNQAVQDAAPFSFVSKIIGVISVVVWLAWTVLVSIYNTRYPKERISTMGLIPAEFQETDEGQQWMTYKACRNVYIYYTFAIPASAFLSMVMMDHLPNYRILFIALGLGQYIVYGLTMWKLHRA